MLKTQIKALVFDQYGTVVDMQGGLTAAVSGFLRDKGWEGEAHRFVTWWRRTHFENSMIDALCPGEHTPYREIGQRAVSYVMDRCGFAYDDDEVRWLVGRIERLEPFPDVIEALGRLAGQYKLAILSNGDADMLEAAKPHIGFDFDHVISVQAAGHFKPHKAPTARRWRSSAWSGRKFCSSPTMPLIASAPSLVAYLRPS
jgi:2-haloacid dehalogenase